MKIYSTAIVKADPAHRNDVIVALHRIVEASRKEAACIQYDLHQSRADTIMASTPAIEARATVTNKGSKSSTAMRVAGSDPLKIITPSKPFNHPLDDFALRVVMLMVRLFKFKTNLTNSLRGVQLQFYLI